MQFARHLAGLLPLGPGRFCWSTRPSASSMAWSPQGRRGGRQIPVHARFRRAVNRTTRQADTRVRHPAHRVTIDRPRTTRAVRKLTSMLKARVASAAFAARGGAPWQRWRVGSHGKTRVAERASGTRTTYTEAQIAADHASAATPSQPYFGDADAATVAQIKTVFTTRHRRHTLSACTLRGD